MNKHFYAIRDNGVGVYLNPFNATNDAEAIRLFTTWVNDNSTNTNINKYPEQFSLIYIGTFNDATGHYTQDAQKELLTGMSVKQAGPKEYTLADLINTIKETNK